LRVQR